ncbi:hypothetical protein TNCV_1194671 [Trichonephila clavipes]|nr:hypothetical protein TNCV_1194671 [Trichonephila clavipes]
MKARFVFLSSTYVYLSGAFVCDCLTSVSESINYVGNTKWEVYKIQFSLISAANRWTEGSKVCQLAASLRGEAAEILQTLPDTE